MELSTGEYLDRALDDDYVREQLREAVVGARRAYVRARRQRARRAVADQKLFDHVTGAAGSLQEAVRALVEPRRTPPRRRARTAKLLLAAISVALAAGYLDKRVSAPTA